MSTSSAIVWTDFVRDPGDNAQDLENLVEPPEESPDMRGVLTKNGIEFSNGNFDDDAKFGEASPAEASLSAVRFHQDEYGTDDDEHVAIYDSQRQARGNTFANLCRERVEFCWYSSRSNRTLTYVACGSVLLCVSIAVGLSVANMNHTNNGASISSQNLQQPSSSIDEYQDTVSTFMNGVTPTSKVPFLYPRVPKALPEMQEACSILPSTNDPVDSIKCAELCKIGHCCLAPGDSNCFVANPNTCQDYLACELVETESSLANSFSTIDVLPPIAGLQNFCSSAAIATSSGRDTCAELCSSGLCCVGLDGDCSSSKHCKDYHSCQHVWPTGSQYFLSGQMSVVEPLKALCSPEKLASAEGKAACDNACKTGTCCFTGTCLENNPLTCDDYRACPAFSSTAMSFQTIVPLPTAPLEVLCSDKSISTQDGYNTCIMQCLPGSCCFEEGDHNCFARNEHTCSHYEECVTVPLLDTNVVPSPVNALCSEKNLETDAGRKACSDVCLVGSCCFSADANCFAENEDLCRAYEPCRSLKQVPPAPEDLQDICESEDSADAIRCKNACKEASCCFAPGAGSCRASNAKECAMYDACPAITTANGGNVDSELSPLSYLCSERHKSTDEGLAECEQECEPAKCCAASGAENCSTANPDFCEEYLHHCQNLWEGPLTKASAVGLESPMESMCSARSIQSAEGRAQCEQACEHAYCCTADGAFNCYKDNAEWCDEVSDACKILD